MREFFCKNEECEMTEAIIVKSIKEDAPDCPECGERMDRDYQGFNVTMSTYVHGTAANLRERGHN